MLPVHLTGTTAQWVTVALVFVTAMGWAIRSYIIGYPERTRAANETKVIEATEMERVLANLQSQIKDFRGEVHGYRNEMQILQFELHASNKVSNQRSDKIDTLESIVELLLSELERIDPDSVIVKQAKIMMRRKVDPTKSEALNVAEHAVADAKQTVRSAENTVVKINDNETNGKS